MQHDRHSNCRHTISSFLGSTISSFSLYKNCSFGGIGKPVPSWQVGLYGLWHILPLPKRKASLLLNRNFYLHHETSISDTIIVASPSQVINLAAQNIFSLYSLAGLLVFKQRKVVIQPMATYHRVLLRYLLFLYKAISDWLSSEPCKIIL